MANPEHLGILRQGADLWNRWRVAHPKERPDLSGINLFHVRLQPSASLRLGYKNAWDFAGLNLSNSDLRGVRLDVEMDSRCQFDLTNADLRNAILDDGVFQDDPDAELTLMWANLTGASLKRTTMAGVRIGGTILGDLDLSDTQGLEAVVHTSRSTIGVDTLLRSRGRIPHKFMRGCGLTDWEIELSNVYRQDLTWLQMTDVLYRVADMRLSEAIHFYSCFISYSTKDQEFADRLYGDLQAKGVRCWFAPHDAQGGYKLHHQIDQAIRIYDRLLLILSEHSMNSEWVATEIAKARKREVRETHQMLFPIRLVNFNAIRDWECFDADTGKDSAREIREYFIPDFSNWKDHDSYRQAFERLLRGLKAEAQTS